MLNKIVGLLLYAWNPVTGQRERVEKTNDSRNAVKVEDQHTAELTERMLNKKPQDGYRLWFDTGDADYIYIMEVDAAAIATDTGFQGIRVTLNADGNPVGKVEINTDAGLTWNTRTTDGNWA